MHHKGHVDRFSPKVVGGQCGPCRRLLRAPRQFREFLAPQRHQSGVAHPMGQSRRYVQCHVQA
eukprot:7987550-Alexandrium_andersonii.AAC.1